MMRVTHHTHTRSFCCLPVLRLLSSWFLLCRAAGWWWWCRWRKGLYENSLRIWCTTIFVVIETIDELIPSFDPMAVPTAIVKGLLHGVGKT
jgi:hypothetical protein